MGGGESVSYPVADFGNNGVEPRVTDPVLVK
jgi:hypothetical protein